MNLRSLICCCTALLVSSPALAADKPNVVIIYADDLGWGDLSCYGHPKFKTPNIDSLAAEGAKLTNFYSCCPYCAPSRVGLQTGRYQFRSGVTNNPAPDAGINDVGIPSEELTLGEMFKAAGYATACIGKWHLGHKPEFHPLKHGYDEYLGILYSNDMRPVELWDGPRVIEYPVYQATLTKRYTERAVAFIERNRERPFFLYLPHAMPHKPLAASEAFYKKSGNGLYADVLAELDWGVGQVLGALHSLGLEQNTLVFFSSDNGPWLGGSSGGLRGMKGQTWEGGIRVPLLARWPGRIPAGHVSHEPAIILDLFATSLTAAGIALPQDRTIDGRDIMPLLTSDSKSPHETIYSIRGNQLFTVRSGKWKFHGAPPGRPPVAPNQAWTD
ncbi:MAG: sulfatase, partial [Planctomycetes bacterium]|nr:sulfatase [Planctomycetota bacterium]